MATPDNESVQYDIRIEATLALKNLADLTNSTTSFNQKIRETTLAVKSAAEQWGMSFGEAKGQLQSLDRELSGTAESSVVFGGAGQAAWNQVGEGSTQAAQKVEQSSQRMSKGIDIVRTAIHFLVVGILFELAGAVRKVFSDMIANVRESELAIHNLVNAEKRLSQEGIDVTPKGLQATIDGLQKLVPILSQIQAEELVSRVATNVAPALGFTDQQIRQLSESIAILYVRNKALGKSFDEVEASVTNAFLTGRVSQGINNLGVKLNDQIVKDEALRLGLVKTEKEFDDLSGAVAAHIKGIAMLSVVYQNATQDIGSLDDYLMTTDAAVERTKTVWSDFATQAGKVFGPIFREGLKVVINSLEIGEAILKRMQPLLLDLAADMIGFVEASKNLSQYFKVGGIREFLQNWVKESKQAAEGFKLLGDYADTATASVDMFNKELDSFDSAKFLNEIQEILDKTQDAIEDLNTQLSRKQADLDLEYRRKQEDAWTDYQRKVEDIQRDGTDKIREIKDKARNDDEEREAKYQLDLWELQQKYLMDLEDALHNRDARQILRLRRQYEFEKEDLAKKKAIEDATHAARVGIEIQQVQQDTERRLEQAKIEYERKLQDLNLAKQREQADLQKWYSRELDDLQTAQQRKLETLIESWVQEGKITEENAKYVYELLKGYFGPGGLTDQLYQYMHQSLVDAALQANQLLNQINPSAPPTGGGGNTTKKTSLNTFAGGLAEGGSFLATTPQTLRVAENRPELVSAVPLGDQGRDLNKLFTSSALSLNGGSEMSGKIELGVDLSPDLEARIINKSMDSAANVVVRVNRSKV